MATLRKAMHNSYFSLIDNMENPTISIFGRKKLKEEGKFEYTLVHYTGESLLDCDLLKFSSFDELHDWLESNYEGGYQRLEEIYSIDTKLNPGLDEGTCCTCKRIILEDDLVTERCNIDNSLIHSRLTKRCSWFDKG